MSEGTTTTNVDSCKKDKYLEDIKNGIPEITICCPVVENLREDAFKIVVGGMEERTATGLSETDKAIIGNDTIMQEGELSIAVGKTASIEELNKLKASRKAKQAKQEAEMQSKEEKLEIEEK